MRVNITGDHVYTSTLGGHKEINLRLVNGHYKVDKENMYTTKGIANKEKKPLVLDKDNTVYDGKKKWTVSKEDISEPVQNTVLFQNVRNICKII